jgi:competence protein ComFC
MYSLGRPILSLINQTIQEKKAKFSWHVLISGFVDILYPKICLVCRNKLKAVAISELVCPGCWAKIKKNHPAFCRRCGRNLEKKSFALHVCLGCIKRTLHFDRAFSPCVYEGTIKELIHQFKYGKKDYLGPLLSSLMIEFIEDYDLPIDLLDLIIPVPLYPARLREREFNQAEILSRQLAKAFNKEVLTDNLIRHRPTKTQTELPPAERLLNVKESFAVKNTKALDGKNILLVDDVLTTGATASEAALTLKDAGAHIVFVLTLAS